MGHALAGRFRDEEEFPTPNGAIKAVAGAVPGDAQHGGVEFVFGHAGQDVGDVVLDAKKLWAREGRDAGRDARITRRQGCLRYEVAGELGGEVIGVRVGGDDGGAGLI